MHYNIIHSLYILYKCCRLASRFRSAGSLAILSVSPKGFHLLIYRGVYRGNNTASSYIFGQNGFKRTTQYLGTYMMCAKNTNSKMKTRGDLLKRDHLLISFKLFSTAGLFEARLRWPNTVFVRALADAIQRVHKDCKNKQAVDTVIILFVQCPLYLCHFSF